MFYLLQDSCRPKPLPISFCGISEVYDTVAVLERSLFFAVIEAIRLRGSEMGRIPLGRLETTIGIPGLGVRRDYELCLRGGRVGI